MKKDIKINRINAGNYTGIYKGVSFNIIKVEETGPDTKNKWYWLINGHGGEDWFCSKAIAIEAVKDSIDEIK